MDDSKPYQQPSLFWIIAFATNIAFYSGLILFNTVILYHSYSNMNWLFVSSNIMIIVSLVMIVGWRGWCTRTTNTIAKIAYNLFVAIFVSCYILLMITLCSVKINILHSIPINERTDEYDMLAYYIVMLLFTIFDSIVLFMCCALDMIGQPKYSDSVDNHTDGVEYVE
jgi:hypothetical protein